MGREVYKVVRGGRTVLVGHYVVCVQEAKENGGYVTPNDDADRVERDRQWIEEHGWDEHA